MIDHSIGSKCAVPGCNAPIRVICVCFSRCNTCAKGHVFHWYTRGNIRFKKIHPGFSDHESPIYCCALPEEKIRVK